VLSAAFIARSAFHTQGGTAFSLFDDAMISMRFARNLVAGHGLRWNVAGRPVEGYSNLLWTLWMAVPHRLGVSDLKTSLFVMVSAAGLLGANIYFVHGIARRVGGGSSLVTGIATWLTALSYPLVFWSLRGMEVGLVAAEITAAVLLALRLAERVTRRDLILFGAVLAAAVITRDDALLPVGLIAVAAIWMAPAGARRVIGVTAVGVIAGTVLAHEIFRVAYYGDALPNTYYLKLAGVPLKTRIKRGLEVDGHLLAATLIAPVAFAVLAVVRRSRYLARGVLFIAAIVVICAVYSTYAGGDAWEDLGFANRYFASVLPLLFVLTALGVEAFIREPARARALWAVAVGGVIVLFALISAADVLPRQLLGLPGPPPLLQLGLALLCAALVVAAAVAGPSRAVLGVVLIAVGVVAAADGTAWRSWKTAGVDGIVYDKFMARYGIALASTTSPNANIAVTWAGAIPYFSQRPAIDQLGKSDSTIAHEAARPVLFRPGHTKWDDDYSIGRLRPDLIAQLRYLITPGDICRLTDWGYTRVAPTVYVEQGTPRVDTAHLTKVLNSLGLDRLPAPVIGTALPSCPSQAAAP
jgi:hypothetical protein